MNILSIDTSTQILSIALQTDSSYEERLVEGNFSHSEDLLLEIEELLDRAKLSIKDLELLICTRGPGSFTGLRVGMATLKGISSALSIPMVSIPTLEVIEKSTFPYKGKILSVIDAKKKRFYLRLSEEGNVLVDDRDGNPEDMIEYLREEETLITGPDAEIFAKKLIDLNSDVKVVVDSLAPRNLSRTLISLGEKRLKEFGPDDIGQGPVYIRRSDAEEALLQKMKESRDEL